MQKKLMLFTPKGMNRDLSVSKFNPEFAFECRNLRLSTNESNTTLSWVNEKGTAPITFVTEGKWSDNTGGRNLIERMYGTPIGTAVINDLLVVFTHEDEPVKPKLQRLNLLKDSSSLLLSYNTDYGTKTAKVVFNESYRSYEGEVVIPETISTSDYTYTVVEIDSGAFLSCTKITSIYLPNSVKIIGSRAFASCSRLRHINIPDNEVTIEGSVFYGCECLREISIPHNAYLPSYSELFYGCHFARDNFNVQSSVASQRELLTRGITFYDFETSDGLLINNDVIVKCRPDTTSISLAGYAIADNVVFPNELTEVRLLSNRFTLDNKINIADRFRNNVIGSFIIEGSDANLRNISFLGYNGHVIINNETPPEKDDDTFDTNDTFTITVPQDTKYAYSEAAYPVDNIELSSHVFDSNTCDHVYLLKYISKELNTIMGIELFKGNLKFDIKYPLETLTSYESSIILKVYWTDGKNLPRLINIADLTRQYHRNGVPVNTSFDFVPEINLTENVDVLKLFGAGGLFPAGVIQYAFTYYNLHGLETNIFRVTPLYYISHEDRAGAPDEIIANAFKITLKDLDTRFDYVRIYSIIRTSIDATPIVKRVQDIKISNLIDEIGGVSISEVNGVNSFLNSVATEEGRTSIFLYNLENALFSNDEYPTEASFKKIDEFITGLEDLNVINQIRHNIPIIDNGYPVENLPSTVELVEWWLDIKYEDALDILDRIDNLESDAEEDNQSLNILSQELENVEEIEYKVLDKVEYYYDNGDGSYTFIGKNSDSAIQIDEDDFAGNIAIPNEINGYTVKVIDTYAFQNCDRLINIKLGSNINELGAGAFSGCISLISITANSIEKIGDDAFIGCTNLKTFSFGANIQEIGKGIFKNCSSLNNIILPTTINYVPVNTFLNCSGLIEITISNSIETIKESAFENCSSLKDLIIPSSVTTIEKKAFYNSGIETLQINSNSENFITINEQAFGNCYWLTNIVIKRGIASGSSTDIFKNCNNLVYAEFTYGDIKNWLAGNTSLEKLVLKHTITSITDRAFDSCSNLTEVTIEHFDSNFVLNGGVFKGCNGLRHLYLDCNIGAEAFSDTYIRNLVIGDNATSIGAQAFLNASLDTVEIGENVSNIGAAAFDSCSSLKSITLYCPPTATIGEDAFDTNYLETIYVLSNLKDAYIEKFENWKQNIIGITRRYNIDNIYYSLKAENDEYNATVVAGPDIESEEAGIIRKWYLGDIVIPELIVYNNNIYNVTSIDNNAFNECLNLNSIDLPESISNIDISNGTPFNGCYNLETITIRNSNFVANDRTISTALSEIFGKLVRKYNVNKDITSIGNYVFYGCTALESFILPNKVETIGEGAFLNCTSLGLGTIELTDEESTEALIIRNSVTTIKKDAFKNCSRLSTLIIGTGIITIGESAFNGCSSLNEVIVRKTEHDGRLPELLNSAFENIYLGGCILRVHPSYIDAYKEKGWTDTVFTLGVKSLKDPRFTEDAKYYYTFKQSLLLNLIIKADNIYYTWVAGVLNNQEYESDESLVICYYFPPYTPFREGSDYHSEIYNNVDGCQNLLIWEEINGESVTRFNARKLKQRPVSHTFKETSKISTPFFLKNTTINTNDSSVLALSRDGNAWYSLSAQQNGVEEKRLLLEADKTSQIVLGQDIYIDKTLVYYKWTKKHGQEDSYKQLYILYLDLYTNSIKYYKVPNINLESNERLDLYIFPLGYYTSVSNGSLGDYKGYAVIILLKVKSFVGGRFECSFQELVRVLSNTEDGAFLFIDTNTTGEAVDYQYLLYLGGESIIALTIEQKDGTLFFGNLSIELPSIKKDIKDSILIENGVLNKNKEKAEAYPLASANILSTQDTRYYVYRHNSYIHTLSSPETHSYTGASAFKNGEYYRLGIQFQYKTGRWSEPCWIGDSQCTATPESDETTGILKLPEFEYTISSDLLNEVFKLGYRRMRAIYMLPKSSDRTILCLGVANPTMFRQCDRNNKLVWALSSWLYRTKFEPDANTGYRVSGDEVAGYVEYSGHLKTPWLPTNWYSNDDVRNGTHEVSDLYIYSTTAFECPPADSGLPCVGVWMPFYRSAEIMGCYTKDEIYQIDGFTATINTPEVDFGETLSDSSLSGVELHRIGYTKLDHTYGDIDILTSTPTIGSSSGFIHKTVSTDKGSAALISGNFYEDNIVYARRDEEENTKIIYELLHDEKDVDRGPVFWPVCMWHRKGSLNNDVNRENRSANLQKKRISNYRHTSQFTEASMQLSYNDIKIWDSEEASQVIKVNGNIYQGCVNTMVVPTEPSYFYFVGGPAGGGDYHYKASFGDVPVAKFFLNDIHNPYYNNWTYSLYNKKENKRYESNWIPKGVPWVKTSQGDEVKYDYYRCWWSMGNIYDDFGKTVAGLTYSREGVPIKYKSSPHIVVSLSGNEILDESENAQIPIVEIRRVYDREVQFGGTSEDAFQEATWIPCGPIVNINPVGDTIVPFKWGDSYYQRYECLKTYAYSPDDINQVVEIGSFMLETRINIDGRYDRNRAQTSNLNASPLNFNLINRVYSLLDNFFSYRILPNEFYKLKHYPNLITWTLTKSSGADIDAWTNVTMASILELDGNVGAISKLIKFNDLLIAFLDRGISLILYNENTLISTTTGVPIEIANSGKVQGKRYLSNTVGCSNKWSIVKSARGIYFMDSNEKSICLFNGELNNLSSSLGLNSWAKDNIPSSTDNWNPLEFENFISYYDLINLDILFINNNEALAYSEKVNGFTSFYDYGGIPYFCNLADTGIWIDGNSNLWKHNGGNYCSFFGAKIAKPYSMILVGNPEPLLDKMFTNIEFRATIDVDESIPFSSLEVWNEYQHGISKLKDKGIPDSTKHDLSDGTASLDRKFRIWRCDIPRDNAPIDKLKEQSMGIFRNNKPRPNDRIRNPWAYIKLSKDTQDNNTYPRCEIHDIVMTYYS